MEKYQGSGEADIPSAVRKDKQDNCVVTGHSQLEKCVREKHWKLDLGHI